jgi:hypothetical protein
MVRITTFGNIFTNEVMDADIHSEAQFGADTVRSADQHWVHEVASLEIKYTAESTNLHVGAGTGGAAHERFDGLDKRVACVHRDTGLCVGQAGGLFGV